jgi:hypothetical protein
MRDGLKTLERSKVLDHEKKVLDNQAESPIKSDDLEPGKTVWVNAIGRKGKPVTVRAIVDSVSGENVTVELYPELQLPVRFMYTLKREFVELA